MTEQVHVPWRWITDEATRIADTWRGRGLVAVYGVPRGGCAPAALVANLLGLPLVDNAPQIEHTRKVLIVDDLMDSGNTCARVTHGYAMPFDCLFKKSTTKNAHAPAARVLDGWLVFPWEMGTADEAGPADAVVRLLEHIGEDPQRHGLVDTPGRVLRALTEMTSGYGVDVGELLTRSFEPDGYSGMIVVPGIDFVSVCEHHMLPFTGTATVGYVPGVEQGIVGLSKLARLVDAFARRLQVQERMTEQIADALETHLRPEGAGVVLRARHACMACRGVRKAHAEMVTSSLRGLLFDQDRARAEFLALAHA